MQKNTLGVEMMSIVNTDDFLRNFIGWPIIIWKNSQPFYFSMEKMENYRFLDIGDGKECIIIIGSQCAFCCGVDDGFGLKVQGAEEHIWIDRMNQNEAVIVIYDRADEEVK